MQLQRVEGERHSAERPHADPSQVADFRAEAKKIVDEKSAEKFAAALQALVSPERYFKPPLRKTTRSKPPVPPPDLIDPG